MHANEWWMASIFGKSVASFLGLFRKPPQLYVVVLTTPCLLVYCPRQVGANLIKSQQTADARVNQLLVYFWKGRWTCSDPFACLNHPNMLIPSQFLNSIKWRWMKTMLLLFTHDKLGLSPCSYQFLLIVHSRPSPTSRPYWRNALNWFNDKLRHFQYDHQIHSLSLFVAFACIPRLPIKV